MKYRILLADLDGTLLDFHKGEAIAIAETFRRFGLPEDEATVAVYSRANAAQWKKLERGETTAERLRVDRFADFLQLLGREGDPAALCEDYVARLGRQRWVLPGAIDLCRRVSGHMPIWLVTNGISDIQRNRMNGCELAPFVSGMVVSEEVGFPKPNPKVLFEALRRAGVQPQQAVLLGDSVTADIAAARSAGIDSILFTAGRDAAPGHGATYTAKTLEEAADLILT